MIKYNDMKYLQWRSILGEIPGLCKSGCQMLKWIVIFNQKTLSPKLTEESSLCLQNPASTSIIKSCINLYLWQNNHSPMKKQLNLCHLRKSWRSDVLSQNDMLIQSFIYNASYNYICVYLKNTAWSIWLSSTNLWIMKTALDWFRKHILLLYSLFSHKLNESICE